MVINLKKFKVFADYRITKEIGVFEAESEEAILSAENKEVNNAIYDKAWDLDVDDPDNVWVEEIEE
jgi:DNA-binding SARP family transcriptional activator